MKKVFLACLLFYISASYIQAQTRELEKDRGMGGIVYYPEPIEKGEKLKSYTINGIVTDAAGEALEAAVISIDKKQSLLSNDEGEFLVEVRHQKSSIIHISVIGYHTVKAIIGPEYNEKTLRIVLRKINLPLKRIEKLENRGPIMIGKPAIYLYPENKTEIEIKHYFKGEVLNTYPAYYDGWKVIAEPSGRLLNVKDNRSYNYLFWDGKYKFPESHYDYKEGFYVSQNDYVNFLLEKLEIIGLNETEINDFIVYWLPVLNEYEETFIHFRINDDIGNSSKLDVTPKPDSMLRVFMEFKQYDGKENKLPEQKLATTIRKQFTLVEWGGGEINSEIIK